MKISNQIIAGFKKGFSSREISDITGLGMSTCQRWIKRFNDGEYRVIKEDHIHHWKVEPPNGTPTVLGICKFCFEKKKFLSSEPPTRWQKK